MPANLNALPAKQQVVIQLLRSLTESGEGSWEVTVDEATAAWLAETGLGPLLWSRVKHTPGCIAEPALRALKATDLSARMLSADTFDILELLLAKAGEQGIPLTLLKGASIAQQLYPQPHWRPMRDIDLMVDPTDQMKFEQILRESGFNQQSTLPAAFFAGHHHSMPFYHPQRRVWVEVHTALFRPYGQFAHIPAFQADALSRERVPVAHESASLWRFTNELQLVYTAIHWGTKLQTIGGLVPIVDTLLLLKQTGPEMDWARVLEMCQDRTLARHLSLLLAYLDRHELYDVPSQLWSGLASGRRSIGIVGRKILLDIIDDYLAGGRSLDGFISEAMLNTTWSTLLGEGNAWRKLLQLPWSILFPPGSAHRSDNPQHLQRLRSLLRRLNH